MLSNHTHTHTTHVFRSHHRRRPRRQKAPKFGSRMWLYVCVCMRWIIGEAFASVYDICGNSETIRRRGRQRFYAAMHNTAAQRDRHRSSHRTTSGGGVGGSFETDAGHKLTLLYSSTHKHTHTLTNIYTHNNAPVATVIVVDPDAWRESPATATNNRHGWQSTCLYIWYIRTYNMDLTMTMTTPKCGTQHFERRASIPADSMARPNNEHIREEIYSWIV